VIRLLKASTQPIVTAASGAGSVGASAYSILADITPFLQFTSAGMSVFLGAYAIYRIFKKNEK